MAKLRHVAISVPDVEKAAAFYEQAFDMTRVGETHGPLADGVYMSDGTMNLALLRFHMDDAMGPGKDHDWFGVHHIGFWIDDPAAQRKQIERAGGTWFMGEVNQDGGYYEVKFTDPFGNIVDISHHGWGGARKDGPPAAAETPRKKRVTKARRVIATGAGRKAAAARGKTSKTAAPARSRPKRAAPKRLAAAARAGTKRTAKPARRS